MVITDRYIARKVLRPLAFLHKQFGDGFSEDKIHRYTGSEGIPELP